jgi:hypothetical protein
MDDAPASTRRPDIEHNGAGFRDWKQHQRGEVNALVDRAWWQSWCLQ